MLKLIAWDLALEPKVQSHFGMPRQNFIPCPEFPYQITSRTNNGDWFSIPMDQVWDLMCDYLYLLHCGFGVEILSFVLMSNHFHLIARFPLLNISAAMNYFLRETSKHIGRLSGESNHVYGGPFHRCRIAKQIYFTHAYKYNYRNPVAAGIVDRCELYPYSTLNGLLGYRKMHVPVREDTTLFSDLNGVLSWLNTTPNAFNSRLIKRALSRPEFGFTPSEKDHTLDFLNY